MNKIAKVVIRVIASIGVSLMLCILSLKTLVFISEAGVDDTSFRVCCVFILVGVLYLFWLIWWYIGLGKEGYEEYKIKRQK